MLFFKKTTSQKQHKNAFCSSDCTMTDGLLQCNCGEDIGIFNWCWSKANSSSNIKVSENNREILFNPFYSSGTAAVRGNIPFQPNLHYYWEIKMISNLYGTDVMVGVGTPEMVFSDWRDKFCSMLGINPHSWGYSYQGNIQHCGLTKKYGKKFGLGSIVGVHLDTCSGTLEYYLNRQPLGIAFTDLKGRELYPMVSSTAAQSAVRINCAVMEESTLQMRCLEFISKHPELYNIYKEIPGLRRLYDKRYFWIVPRNKEDEEKRLAALEDKLMNPLRFKNFLNRNGEEQVTRLQLIPPEMLDVYGLAGFSDDSSLDLEASSDDDDDDDEDIDDDDDDGHDQDDDDDDDDNDNDSSDCSFSYFEDPSVGDCPSTSNRCGHDFEGFGRTPFKNYFKCCLVSGGGNKQVNNKTCTKCEFRMELENDNFSDSSGS